MRITGGTLRGRLVKVPGGIIRPAMDRMRESVFARLGDLSGLSFLDLFSGSGIVALEAASRGAVYIEAVEMDSLKRKTLLENVQISPVRINCRFMAAELYVKRAKRPFNIIFCDPPFSYKFKRQLVEALLRSKLMISSSKLLFHHPRNGNPEEIPACLTRETPSEYGRSVVDFFVRR
jgi:16S rRNA (guanine(966)-N(2))-methyltransferase RsmD